MLRSSLPIAKTLNESASGIRMNDDSAKNALNAILGSAGIAAAAITFTPVLSAVIPKSLGIKVIASSSAAIGGSIIISAMALSSMTPEFSSVTYNSSYTNQDVAVTVNMKEDYDLNSIYCFDSNGNNVNISYAEAKTYQIDIPFNGDYTIVADGANGKSVSYDFSVSCIDKSGPALDNYSSSDDSITVHFYDEMGKVDFNSVYGIGEDGSSISPTRIDASSGNAVFAIPDQNFTIYVSDSLGNVSSHYVSIQ